MWPERKYCSFQMILRTNLYQLIDDAFVAEMNPVEHAQRQCQGLLRSVFAKIPENFQTGKILTANISKVMLSCKSVSMKQYNNVAMYRCSDIELDGCRSRSLL